jgi:hypothetical protein
MIGLPGVLAGESCRPRDTSTGAVAVDMGVLQGYVVVVVRGKGRRSVRGWPSNGRSTLQTLQLYITSTFAASANLPSVHVRERLLR